MLRTKIPARKGIAACDTRGDMRHSTQNTPLTDQQLCKFSATDVINTHATRAKLRTYHVNEADDEERPKSITFIDSLDGTARFVNYLLLSL